jgi:DHA1 family tetracycline resistance protein-like MFS transporter
MPILPFYAESLGASASALGGILSAYAAAQFVCAPLWGRLSDRVGRRRVMLLTISGTSLSLLFLGLAPSLLWVLAARLLGGGFAANISVATAYVGDVTDEADRTRWMGLIGASFGVGFVLGPAIGGALAPFGNQVPLLAAAGLAAANLLHAALSLREPERLAEPAVEAGASGAVLRDQRVRRLCLANFAFAVAVTQLETVFAYFMLDRFAYNASQVAAILVGMAVVMGGIQGGGMKALSARFDERRLVVAGCALLAGGFLWIPGAHSVPVLMLPLLLAAMGRAVAQPSLMSLASLASGSRARGAVMGTFQASASLARVLGPLAGGCLYDREVAAPFLLAAALLAGLVVAGRFLPSRAQAAAR